VGGLCLYPFQGAEWQESRMNLKELDRFAISKLLNWLNLLKYGTGSHVQGNAMATITIEIPDDLMEQLTPLEAQLPELLRRCVQESPLPAQVYRYILNFLTSQPSPEQIAAFRPTPDMQEQLRSLLAKNQAGTLTAAERQELDEYERIEHLIVMLKLGNLPYLTPTTASS
jgi:hypothetical protein